MRENPLRPPAPMGSDGWVYARSEALFIGGRSGVGKTSAGNEIHAQLAAAGVRHCLIDGDNSAAVVEDVSNRLTAAMGDHPRVKAVLLTCTDSTARRRLSQRERGSGLESHVERGATMARMLDRGVPRTVHMVETDDRSIAEIAAEIIGFAGWLPRT